MASEVKVRPESLKKIHAIMKENQKKGIEHYYLFLDFDGVINVFIDPDNENAEKIMKQRAAEFDFADRDCVKRLDDLLRDYPIDVVISSSWRWNGLDYCIDYLKKAGLQETDKIIGSTKIEYNVPRQQEIADYLLEHPDFSGFLIFDDIPMPEYQAEWVETHPYQGYDKERDSYARKLITSFA